MKVWTEKNAFGMQSAVPMLEVMVFFQQIDPKKRPSFVEIAQTLEEIKQRSQMAIVLADISNLNISKDEVMSKTILNKILGA